MATIQTKPRQRTKRYPQGKAYYIVLTPKEAREHGVATSSKNVHKWVGPYSKQDVAKQALQELKATLQRRKVNATPLLRESYESWLETTAIRESTKDLYKACWPHLEPLHAVPLGDISKVEVKQLLESLLFSKSRVKSVRTLLNHCFAQAMSQELIDVSPMVDLKVMYRKPSRVKELKFWTKEQANVLLSHYPKPRFDLFYRLALHTGCRRGELLALRWEHLNASENTIYVCATYDRKYGYRPPKTDRSKRTIKLRQQEIDALKQQHHRSLDYVFQRPDKPEPISINSVQKEFYTLCDSLNLPHIGLHGLRHTHATIALQARTPVEIISKRLGHSTVSMAYETYRHVIPAEDKALADVLGALLD